MKQSQADNKAWHASNLALVLRDKKVPRTSQAMMRSKYTNPKGFTRRMPIQDFKPKMNLFSKEYQKVAEDIERQ